ncbi:MAG TPA: TGS domain-containing protein, partial [Clostridia bacterium]|nr:TGS domain-containing protein [Clostridia bacterium]
MSQITISFPDGKQQNFDRGLTLLEIAKIVSPRLSKEALAAKWNDTIMDLSFQPQTDGQVEFLTFDHEEGQEVYRHSTAHILAQAVKRLFPATVLGIGPAIADGFYYDFDSQHKFSPEDLEAIETEMRKIISEKHSYQRSELPRN